MIERVTELAELPFEYFLGRACRKFRRGTLDLSASRMIEQSGQHISRSRISDFENGHTHSTKFLQLYVLADTTKQNELSTILKQATDDYISYLAKLSMPH